MAHWIFRTIAVAGIFSALLPGCMAQTSEEPTAQTSDELKVCGDAAKLTLANVKVVGRVTAGATVQVTADETNISNTFVNYPGMLLTSGTSAATVPLTGPELYGIEPHTTMPLSASFTVGKNVARGTRICIYVTATSDVNATCRGNQVIKLELVVQ